MKCAALILVSLVVICSPLLGQESPFTYMGLYTDEARSMWCAGGMPPYQVDMWVYALIGQGGLTAYSLSLAYPENVEVVSLSLNQSGGCPPITCLPGYCENPPGLLVGEFCEPFKENVIWLVHGTLNVTSPDEGVVQIVSNPPLGSPLVKGFWGGIYIARVLTQLYINYDPSSAGCAATAVEEKSWGAIKNLFR
jgi:hypothetical protein